MDVAFKKTGILMLNVSALSMAFISFNDAQILLEEPFTSVKRGDDHTHFVQHFRLWLLKSVIVYFLLSVVSKLLAQFCQNLHVQRIILALNLILKKLSNYFIQNKLDPYLRLVKYSSAMIVIENNEAYKSFVFVFYNLRVCFLTFLSLICFRYIS